MANDAVSGSGTVVVLTGTNVAEYEVVIEPALARSASTSAVVIPSKVAEKVPVKGVVWPETRASTLTENEATAPAAVSLKVVAVFPNGFEGVTKAVLVGVQVVPDAGGQAPPVPRSNFVSVNETPPGSVRKFESDTVPPGGVVPLLMPMMWPYVGELDDTANVPVLLGSIVKLPCPEVQDGPPG